MRWLKMVRRIVEQGSGIYTNNNGFFIYKDSRLQIDGTKISLKHSLDSSLYTHSLVAYTSTHSLRHTCTLLVYTHIRDSLWFLHSSVHTLTWSLTLCTCIYYSSHCSIYRHHKSMIYQLEILLENSIILLLLGLSLSFFIMILVTEFSSNI